MRVVCSTGGSGGHIFPGVAVAQELKKRNPQTDILFIGAKGRMEMQKVPKAGFDIEGLWISGFQRSLTFKNALFPIKLINSLFGARKILKRFQPDVVTGFGGYASGAALWTAAKMGYPTLIMEQNSLPGVTNRLLNGKADVACLAYDESKKYFDKSKVIITGNPIRSGLETSFSKKECLEQLGLDPAKRTILITGGSQGAGSINAALADATDAIKSLKDVQFYWQCGAGYMARYKDCATAQLENVKISAFIEDMAIAYGAADLTICRGGALSIAELMYLGKPAIIVPSPNVAEDHQTVNAKSALEHDAAILLRDAELENMIPLVKETIYDDARLEKLSKNIKTLSRPNAVIEIADQIEMLAKK